MKESALERWEQMRRAQQLSEFSAWREFSGCSTGWSLGGLPELKRWSWEFRETKVTIFHRAEYWKGESCTEKIPKLYKAVSGIPNRAFIGRNYPRRKKNHPKGLEGTDLRGHTELKIVPVPQARLKNS